MTELNLEPLPAGEIRRVVQSRLGAGTLPEALARQVTEKSEGNPLFAEEISSYLAERGVLRAVADKLDFQVSGGAVTLPASVQSLLTARVDRLAAADRFLLQVASVIGRRFDPSLITTIVDQTDIDARLATLQSSDLIHRDNKSDDYVFKHALVRDALYQGLLNEARKSLHLKIAEEIERRSGNPLTEVAEALAHHYSQTERSDKGFTYLSMAGSKSLSMYSLEEASNYFTAALALLDRNPDCASDNQVAEFLEPYLRLLHFSGKFYAAIDTVERNLGRIDSLGDDPRVVLIRHHYVLALIFNHRFRDAASVQQKTLPMAERLGDSRSKAYALSAEIFVETFTAPKTLNDFEALERAATAAATDTADAHLQNHLKWHIGWKEQHLGRMNYAREWALELMQVGQRLNDPRSIGFGLGLLTWTAIFSNSFAEALEYSEQSLAVAVTPLDRSGAIAGKAVALALLGRTDQSAALFEELRSRCAADGGLYIFLATESAMAVCEMVHGKIRSGIKLMEVGIHKAEQEGYRVGADWARLNLAEAYLQILAGNEKPPLAILLKNIPTILIVMFAGPSRVRALATHVLTNTQIDGSGFHIGRAHMLLGLLDKFKKKRQAVEHLTEAKRIFSQFGQSPILARVETALAELGQ